ncbi:hypothetical protein IID20_00380 [Patescibacteria group bacterium]|nr:hypothetical protein [Patescibacteria group bacterium]
MKIFLTIYRITLIIAFLLFFSWLAYKNTVVSGQLYLEKNFCEQTDFISDLYPENRIGGVEQGESGECFQRIFVEPAYFRVKIPRTFALVKLKIIYDNPDQNILQLGLMKKRINPLDWEFKIKPIENKIFDTLDWFKLSESDIILWQKQKKFETIYEYVNNLPIDQKTATFYYQFSTEAVEDSTKVVSWNIETPLEYVDYIITQYTPPKRIDEHWQEQVIEFLVGQEYISDHYLEFMISAPGLTERRYEIKIKNITVELNRPQTDWSAFLSDLKNYLIRKFSKLTS